MNYQPTPDLLDGRVILVTGAGDGIGKTAAECFARHGATVILLGRTTTKLEAVYDEIADNDLPLPGIAPMDLATAKPDDIIELANVIQQTYGRLDGLLHNAAQLGKLMPLESFEPSEWMRIMQVNLHAPFLLTRYLMPMLRASDDASLLFTTSGVGTTPKAYWGAYATSKHGVEGLATLFAEELENTSSIRTNLISPGPTQTSMRAAAFPNENPSSLKPPEALMPLYLYLMGPDSKSENGKLFTEAWLEKD